MDMPTMPIWLFEKFCGLIHTECGITLNDQKRTMLESRLYKRLILLGFSTYEEYYNYLSDNAIRHTELESLINAVTTNKTEFFRERKHFLFLSEIGLPEIVSGRRFRVHNRINVWSAGCSTGEEPYTIAMTLAEFFGGKTVNFHITATDISTHVLEIARKAVYTREIVEPVPGYMKMKYLMKGKGKFEGMFRIVPELRNAVNFVRLNFRSLDFGMQSKMDIIFCRNVIIYFDHDMRVKLINQMYRQLNPGGLLFIGHSETLSGISDRFELLAPTIYQKPFASQEEKK